MRADTGANLYNLCKICKINKCLVFHPNGCTYREINSCTFTYIRAQWLRSRTLDSRLRKHGFESCAAVLNPLAILFTLHCSSSPSYINEYLAVDSSGYVY